MAQEEMLILLGHAWQCPTCQEKLLQQKDRVLMGRGLREPEKKAVMALTPAHFSSLGALAEATGTTTAQLYDIMNHPRCRLRHF